MGFGKVVLGGKALQTEPENIQPLAITAGELALMGVPPRKLTRVMAELHKAVDADPCLNHPGTLARLAKNLAPLFL